MKTMKGDRKVYRPVGADYAFAEQMGVSKRTVIRLGGAKYLKSLPEESLNLILKPKRVHVGKTGLAARGMTCQQPVNHKGIVEEVIQIRLRQRGLHG